MVSCDESCGDYKENEPGPFDSILGGLKDFLVDLKRQQMVEVVLLVVLVVHHGALVLLQDQKIMGSRTISIKIGYSNIGMGNILSKRICLFGGSGHHYEGRYQNNNLKDR